MSSTGKVQARRIPYVDLEPVGADAGAEERKVRLLHGGEYGLDISVMHAQIAPGYGPPRHRHPYVEVFVLHAGEGRYEIDGTNVDAVAGDMVIVPADAWHAFTSTGMTTLLQTAIHQNPRAITFFEDGTQRE